MNTTTGIIPNVTSSDYNQTVLTKDANGIITDILFSGLEVKLSDLVNQFPYTGGITLTIYADNLIADVPNFNVQGAVIVANTLDISSLGGEAWPVQIPTGQTPAVVECLIMNTLSNGNPASLGFITNKTLGINPPPLYTLPTNGTNLQVGTFIVESNGNAQGSAGNSSDFSDLIGRPFALNSFYAIFSQVTNLLNKGDNASLNQAQNKLTWIYNCIKGCANIPSTHFELFSQVSALLATLNIPANYHYLSVLSSSYYGTQINQFISAAESYENNLSQLQQQSASQNIIQTISSGLFSTSQMELAPSKIEFQQLNNGLDGQYDEIIKIANSYYNQVTIADTKSALLKATIKNAQIQKFLIDGVKTAIDVVKSGVSIAMAVAKEGEGTGEAIGNVTETFVQGYETIKGITETFNQGNLIEDAKKLMEDSQTLLINVLSSSQIWNQVNNPSVNSSNNFNPTQISIDPNLSWDNYMAEVKSVLSSLSTSLKDSELSSAQDSANDYLASLEILSNYGKSLNAKLIAYSNMLCQAVVVKSKIQALNNIQTLWGNLANQSKTEQEKISALEGLIRMRKDATMRSLYLSWTMYRDAYLYNFLIEPVQIIDLKTSIGDLKQAFASISSWVQGLPGLNGNGSTILPNTGATITINIPVISETVNQGTLSSNPLTAYMIPAADSNGTTTISFSIPDIYEQFKGQIGAGDVAIWITAGEFYLNGVKANASGFVPMVVSTSGHYINGYQDNIMQFISNSISSHFAYIPGTTPRINVQWKVNSEQYMLPTPFSLWTLEVDGSCDVSNVNNITVIFTTNLCFKK